MGLASELMKISPYPELVARKLYYSFFRGKIRNKPERNSSDKNEIIRKVDAGSFFRHLKQLGIKEGDLLIIHSSASSLSSINCKEPDLLNGLIELVGEKGTIALPAFPDESMLKQEDGIKIYDPKRSVAWTGMIPNLLLRKKGAVRSPFPCNPLVAYGALAEEMMAHNLETAYAHGENSCWGFCVEHHAKVLFLGVPTYHSNTMLHVVEDYQPDFWPNDWYEGKEYYTKVKDNRIKVTARVRQIKWSKYLSERHTEQKYIKAGFIERADFEGIPISIINDSYEMVDKILSNWEREKFFYIPKRMLRFGNERMRI